MTVDDRARHRLYLRLEEVLGHEEAGTLMSHLPPVGWGEVATKADTGRLEHRMSADLQSLEHRLTADMESLEYRLKADMESLEYRLTATMERLARRLVMWTSSMVLAAAALAFAAGRFA